MRSSILGAAALSATGAMGYLNTSPFFAFSTSPKFGTEWSSQITESSRLNSVIARELSSCPSEYYIFVSQSGVSSTDYIDSQNTPTLASNLRKSKDSIRKYSIVPDVLGSLDVGSWERTLATKCKVSSLKLDTTAEAITSIPSANKLLTISFPAPSKPSRLETLNKNDAYLASILALLPSESYTVLYTTTSLASQDGSVIPEREGEKSQYEMDVPLFDIPRTELKRSLHLGKRQDDSNSNTTLIDGPLFARYQFFTPGVWMGFFATFILLAILYVGISALAGLQVTYAAFDKENGPLASKKSQ